MLTLEDCIALSGLTQEEIAAIAGHEHIPGIPAAARGDRDRALRLKLCRRHFME